MAKQTREQMSNDEKKELLSNLKQLQKLAIDNIGWVGHGFCELMWTWDEVLFESLKSFIDSKVKCASGYLFRYGEVTKRMEWLQVEIEKLEASIVFLMY